MKMIVYVAAICLFALLLSCNNHHFYKFDNPEVSFQIYPKKEGILKAINTNGEGARKLQLFTTNAKLSDEVIMHNEPFEISKWENNIVEVKFFVSDLRLFKPWFVENKFKPKKIGEYSINYTYVLSPGGSTIESSFVDSIYIDREVNSVSFFLDDNLLNRASIESIEVYRNKFRHYDYENNLIIEYRPKENSMIKEYMESIILSYK